MRRRYEIVVVGGGHAGVEAAWAAANILRADHAVALVTLRADTIGAMSCNPAIGGLAKGQLVREIDALGGLMALAADATGIHFKVLNRSKGPAVRGPRCQSDNVAYPRVVRAMVEARPEIDVIEGAVESFEIESDQIRGVRVRDATGETLDLSAHRVILTTGTFMRGLMHTGDRKTPGGRAGEAPATAISSELVRLGFELGRLKTGTPPRLRKGSIDWDALDPDPGDERAVPFSDLTRAGEPLDTGADEVDALHARFPVLDPVECRQTRTDASSHELIRQNLHRAPMYSGEIDSAGPRYCPAIEDKVVRFPDRESHGVFLEPESLHTDWVYCNGISSSLPKDVQVRIVRAMPGCENAEILRFGYAVEYDMVRPHQILATGETKRVRGLYLAGQINGTSGYEEAAAQGLVAGVNAARQVRGEGEWVLGRDEAYIGVLMDDLVTKTPREPYRMFTSRAEHRLVLRADNASDRLTRTAESLGLLGTPLGNARLRVRAQRDAALDAARAQLRARVVDGKPLRDVVRRSEFTLDDFRAVMDPATDESVLLTVFADARYEPYVQRELAQIRRQREMESKRLPPSIDYAMLTKLRPEARHALDRFRPATFGQASRLEGITPADLTLLSVVLRQRAHERPAERGVPSTGSAS